MILANLAENNPNWKGDEVGYHGVHWFIRTHLPKPEDDKCQLCEGVKKLHAACVTHIYNREFKNWRYLCHSCNRYYDNNFDDLKSIFL